jgi:hypothetical protein
MKKLLLAALLLASTPALALEGELEQQYRVRRGMEYWGLGSGVVGGALAVPLTVETLRIMEDLRHSRNPVDACVKGLLAVIILPPMFVVTGASWVGAVGGTGVGLGGSLAARGTLRDAGGRVTPVPAIGGIAALSATPALLIIGLDQEDEALVLSGIGTFAAANALLLTQSLLNGAEYRQLSGIQRDLVIPPITISGRF